MKEEGNDSKCHYRVLRGKDLSTLSFEVEKWMSKGWLLAGGIAYGPSSIYMQSVHLPANGAENEQTN